MNDILFAAFHDELEKLSYDVRKLRGAWGRVKGWAPGADTAVFPTKRQTRLQFGTKPPPGTAPGRISRMPIREHGQIVQRWTGREMSPQAMRSADGFSALHESAERRRLPGLSSKQEARVLRASAPLQRKFQHANQSVMAQDYNLSQKASIPKGLEDVDQMIAEQELKGVNAMRAQRDASGQTAFLKTLYLRNLGPGAAAFFEPGAKIPKAAVRRVNRLIADRGTLFPKTPAISPRG